MKRKYEGCTTKSGMPLPPATLADGAAVDASSDPADGNALPSRQTEVDACSGWAAVDAAASSGCGWRAEVDAVASSCSGHAEVDASNALPESGHADADLDAYSWNADADLGAYSEHADVGDVDPSGHSDGNAAANQEADARQPCMRDVVKAYAKSHGLSRREAELSLLNVRRSQRGLWHQPSGPKLRWNEQNHRK